LSGEPCPYGLGAGEVDRAVDVVGEHAERRFAGDSLEASGEESAACGHPFDRSERMFGGASALPDQARVGLEAGVHPFEGLLVQVTGDEATLCGRAARLQRAARAIACGVEDEAVAPHHLLAGEGAAGRADVDVGLRLIGEGGSVEHRTVALAVDRPIGQRTGRDVVGLAAAPAPFE